MSRPDRPLTVCALVPYPPGTAPSQRFRIEQWLPDLRAAGISVDLLPFADGRLSALLSHPGRWAAKLLAGLAAVARRLAHCAAVPRYDAVLVHRAACIAGPAFIERIVRLLRRPIIFDFDDAIWMLHTSLANRRFAWLKFPGKTRTICRLSSHVVVGNAFLAEYARQYNPHVSVVPTSIDTGHYRPQPARPSNGRVVVGWTGSSTSQTHLEMFAPVLRDLLRRPDVELRVISNRRPELGDLPSIWRPWSAQTEVEELSRLDLGIMPMPDDPWARGKCALKALQYMAMGIPTVCSAVGANCEVVRHEENGLLASTPEEWISHLTRLIDDPAARRRLGDAGRHTVEQQYSATRCAELFAQVVYRTLGRTMPPGVGTAS